MLSVHHTAQGYVCLIRCRFPLLVGVFAEAADSGWWVPGERGGRISLYFVVHLSNYNKSKLSGRLNAVDQGRLGSGSSTHYRWKRKWLSAAPVITPIDPLATKARLCNKGQKRLIYLCFSSTLYQMLLHVPLFSLPVLFLSTSLTQKCSLLHLQLFLYLRLFSKLLTLLSF